MALKTMKTFRMICIEGFVVNGVDMKVKNFMNI